MSRIGKLKIPCPEGVTVTQTDGTVVVKGPNGELSEPLHPFLSIHIDADGIQVQGAQAHFCCSLHVGDVLAFQIKECGRVGISGDDIVTGDDGVGGPPGGPGR